jgi:hypothetical protein
MKNNKLCIMLVVCFLSVTMANAQTTGNPAILQPKSWSLGLSGEYARYTMEHIEYTSVRGLLKGDITVYRYVTVSLTGGSANMVINYPLSSMRTRLDSKNSLALGVSAKLNGVPLLPSGAIQYFPYLSHFKIICDGGALHFTPAGHSYSTSALAPGDIYYKFDWREFYATVGTILLNKPYDIYIAYQGRIIRQYEKFSQQTYRSGLLSSIIVGLEIHLPQHYVINFQVRSFNGSAVSVGISQSAFFKMLK